MIYVFGFLPLSKSASSDFHPARLAKNPVKGNASRRREIQNTLVPIIRQTNAKARQLATQLQNSVKDCVVKGHITHIYQP